MNFMRSLVVLCVSLFLCPCLAWSSEELVNGVLLKQAGLQSSWQIQLPLNPTEQLDQLYIFGDYLYILTDHNFFFCIERSSGSVRSLFPLTVAGLPVLPPIHFENQSVFLIGQELKVFDPVQGRITRTMTLSQLSGSSGSIARSSDNVYVCGSDNRLYAFSASEGIRLYMVTSDNDSPIHSVIASDKTVWFATTEGNIVAMDPWNRQKIWQYNITGKMKTPLILEDGYLYAGGLDAKLYKLDSKYGKLVWKEPFIAGDAVEESLVLGKTCIYAYTAVTGLYAVNKETGKAVWNLPQGHSAVSEMNDQVYVYVEPGILSLMDNVSGKEKLSINIAGVNRFAVNMTDSVLYLAQTKGCVMAAKPIAQDKADQVKP